MSNHCTAQNSNRIYLITGTELFSASMPLDAFLSIPTSAPLRRKMTRSQAEISLSSRETKCYLNSLSVLESFRRGGTQTLWFYKYWLTDHYLTQSHSEKGCPSSAQVIWAGFTVGKEAKMVLQMGPFVQIQGNAVMASTVRWIMELMCYIPVLLPLVPMESLPARHCHMQSHHSRTCRSLSLFSPRWSNRNNIASQEEKGNHSLFKYLMAARILGPFSNTTTPRA